jgi:hypothetical protein
MTVPARALVTVPEGIVWVDFDPAGDVHDELALFNSSDGTYHTLDPIGGFVWRRVAAGDDLAAIVATLQARYDQDGAVIAADVRSFLNRAVERGLLVLSGPAG